MTQSRTCSPRGGATLVELLVVLAILATAAGLVGVAFRRPIPPVPTTADHIAAARRSAIATGSPVVVAVIESDSQRVLVLPDGSVVGAEQMQVDRLSGRPSDATR